jgi:MFS family permease
MTEHGNSAPTDDAALQPGWQRRRRHWLRRTLRLSQQEAVASSTTTATGDNFFNAFAIHLGANAVQMGWLTAFPQFFGALMQLLSAWLGGYLPRKPLVVFAAAAQALAMLLLAGVAAWHGSGAVAWLIALAIVYHAALNLLQPQWRAWMGSLVPQRRRGAFFAARTRLTMVSTLIVFVGGGALLSFGNRVLDIAWLGFCVLFAIAAVGRMVSASLLWRMHDPDPRPAKEERDSFRRSLTNLRDALRDKTFRDYTLFVAGMQGMVAISAPFFAVYMLRDLQFSYLHFTINHAASIATQFATLHFWGRFSDRFGNRIVMLATASLLPVLPLLWLVSPDAGWLILVQVISGIAWSGFTLSTANYLYDIRPHKTRFATYAAVQSAFGAALVFAGALAGGYLASAAPTIIGWLPFADAIGSPLFLVFLISGLLRAGVIAWFWPRAVEPRIRRRPQVLQVIYRVARFSAISGVVLDWLTVTTKRERRREGD